LPNTSSVQLLLSATSGVGSRRSCVAGGAAGGSISTIGGAKADSSEDSTDSGRIRGLSAWLVTSSFAGGVGGGRDGSGWEARSFCLFRSASAFINRCFSGVKAGGLLDMERVDAPPLAMGCGAVVGLLGGDAGMGTWSYADRLSAIGGVGGVEVMSGAECIALGLTGLIAFFGANLRPAGKADTGRKLPDRPRSDPAV
jgi:hypothetical protein